VAHAVQSSAVVRTTARGQRALSKRRGSLRQRTCKEPDSSAENNERTREHAHKDEPVTARSSARRHTSVRNVTYRPLKGN